MGEHWSYVIAAYALAAVVLGAYWRALVRGERTLRGQRTRQEDGR
jgi:heme exporter protein D